MKKILLIAGAVLAVAAGVAAVSAYEAHVINVTATIENALYVPTNPIEFGTVFPNEVLYKDLDIQLSGSFLEEERVDDVVYEIRQKAKPYEEEDHDYCQEEYSDLEGCVGDEVGGGASLGEAIEYCAQYYDEEENCYLPLCPFLSKLPDTDVPNDEGVSSPHEPGAIAYGNLSKIAGDIIDNWTIDLEVPCFIGTCAQGEEGYLPADWEHGSFGCDLWVEVTGISERPR